MLGNASLCGVCGSQGSDGVCLRCGSVISSGATCPMCNEPYEGPLAQCDRCESFPETDAQSLPEGIWALGQLPGVGKMAVAHAGAQGLQDAASVFALALSDRAIKLGVHRAMTRQLSLREIPGAKKIRKTVGCETCGYHREGWRGVCPVCGVRERPVDGEEVEAKMASVQGEIFDLKADPDFKLLPQRFRDELLEEFARAGIETVVESEFDAQFKEWRARGIDTSELEQLLREQGSSAFRTSFVGVLREQLDKRKKERPKGKVNCPVCDHRLPSSSSSCMNCGSRFR